MRIHGILEPRAAKDRIFKPLRGHAHRDHPKTIRTESMVPTIAEEDARLERLVSVYESALTDWLNTSPSTPETQDKVDATHSALTRGVRNLAGGRWVRPGTHTVYAITTTGSLEIYQDTALANAIRASRSKSGQSPIVLTKRCFTCGIDKPKSEFDRAWRSLDGIRRSCQTCVKSGATAMSATTPA